MKRTFTEHRDAIATWLRKRGASYPDPDVIPAAACTWAAARGHPAAAVWGALLHTGHTLPQIRARKRFWGAAQSHVADGDSSPSRADERLRVARRLVGHLLTEAGTDGAEIRAVDTALVRRAFAIVALEALANTEHADRPGVAIGGKELAIRAGVSPVTGQRLLKQMHAFGWLRPFKRLAHGGHVWKLGRLRAPAREMAEEQQSDLVDALTYDGDHPAADVVRSAGHLGWQQGAAGRSAWVIALADSLGWRKPGHSAQRPEHKELEARAAAIGARPAWSARRKADAWLAGVLAAGSLAAGLDGVAAADPSLAEKAAARRAARDGELEADRARVTVAESRGAVTRAARALIREAGGDTWDLNLESATAWMARLRAGQWAGAPEIVRARAAQLIAHDLQQAGLAEPVAVARGAGIVRLGAAAGPADVAAFASAVAADLPDGGADVGRAVAAELERAGRGRDEAVRIGMRVAGLEAVAA